MADDTGPRDYKDWRRGVADREEDAAYLFGCSLMRYCRAEALKRMPADASPETRKSVEESVDTALHNVMDLLEGFWRIPADDSHTADFALHVNVRDAEGKLVETQVISPCKLDLPIGYWAWRDGQFR